MLKKIKLFYLSILLLVPSLLPAASLLDQENKIQIQVDNKILAKVNGNPITVVDVMKKLDIAFFRQFPQYASSPDVHLQFYQLNWRKMLRDLIDKELILADAKMVNLPVSNADVRQEMEQLFGPGIIANLDKISISFEEAREILEGDITIRRMLYLRVNSKAAAAVTPQMVKTAYEKYSLENPKAAEWSYRVLSIRDPDSELGAENANHLYHYLTEEKVPIEQVKELASEQKILSTTTSVTLSETFKQNEKDISPAHKQGIEGLSPGQYSLPIAQQSRDKSKVFRIFYLSDFVPGGAVPFKDMEDTLYQGLLEVAGAKEADRYIGELEKQIPVEMNPELEELEPFTAKKG